MAVTVFTNATLVLPDRLVPGASLVVDGGRIAEVRGSHGGGTDLGGMYLAPGFFDLHVHGGAGADFMDGTADAFRTVCQAHARHGTTGLLATTTVARFEQYISVLGLCRRFESEPTGGAAVFGAHFYGPYFAP